MSGYSGASHTRIPRPKVKKRFEAALIMCFSVKIVSVKITFFSPRDLTDMARSFFCKPFFPLTQFFNIRMCLTLNFISNRSDQTVLAFCNGESLSPNIRGIE